MYGYSFERLWQLYLGGDRSPNLVERLLVSLNQYGDTDSITSLVSADSNAWVKPLIKKGFLPHFGHALSAESLLEYAPNLMKTGSRNIAERVLIEAGRTVTEEKNVFFPILEFLLLDFVEHFPYLYPTYGRQQASVNKEYVVIFEILFRNEANLSDEELHVALMYRHDKDCFGLYIEDRSGQSRVPYAFFSNQADSLGIGRGILEIKPTREGVKSIARRWTRMLERYPEFVPEDDNLTLPRGFYNYGELDPVDTSRGVHYSDSEMEHISMFKILHMNLFFDIQRLEHHQSMETAAFSYISGASGRPCLISFIEFKGFDSEGSLYTAIITLRFDLYYGSGVITDVEARVDLFCTSVVAKKQFFGAVLLERESRGMQRFWGRFPGRVRQSTVREIQEVYEELRKRLNME